MGTPLMDLDTQRALRLGKSSLYANQRIVEEEIIKGLNFGKSFIFGNNFIEEDS